MWDRVEGTTQGSGYRDSCARHTDECAPPREHGSHTGMSPAPQVTAPFLIRSWEPRARGSQGPLPSSRKEDRSAMRLSSTLHKNTCLVFWVYLSLVF